MRTPLLRYEILRSVSFFGFLRRFGQDSCARARLVSLGCNLCSAPPLHCSNILPHVWSMRKDAVLCHALVWWQKQAWGLTHVARQGVGDIYNIVLFFHGVGSFVTCVWIFAGPDPGFLSQLKFQIQS